VIDQSKSKRLSAHKLLPKDIHILALHGFTGGGADFSAFTPYCDQYLNWACPDLPGHGPNPLLDCRSEAMIAFIEAQRANALADDAQSRKVLLGYSMGARAALQHACAFPSAWDALILISSNPGVVSIEERLQRRKDDVNLVAELKSDGLQNFMQRWQEQPLISSQKNITPACFNAMQATREQHEVDGLAANLTQFGQGSAPNLWDQLSKLKQPVLIITGSLDAKYQRIGAQMDEQLPYSKHAVIEGASHMPHLEKPKATAEVIEAFLAELTSAT
jgi:2-succinyl-6-hydroxy-2,4-cyclohexadiene-1-carboxylate synthase